MGIFAPSAALVRGQGIALKGNLALQQGGSHIKLDALSAVLYPGFDLAEIKVAAKDALHKTTGLNVDIKGV